jgi:Tol biopolymer transport system component
VRRIWILLLGVVILVALTAAILWFGAPRLVAFTPQAAAVDVPAAAVLQLKFSRPMQPSSVEDRLTIEPSGAGSFTWDGKTLTVTPKSHWPAGAVVQVKLRRGARAAGWLSLATNQDASWTFTVRQPRLLYLYPSDAASNLYLYDLRTQESKPLTDILVGILEYDVTFDGSAVYYSVRNAQGGSDIYRLGLEPALENSKAEIILACGLAECRAPRLSRQEDYLAYERIAPAGSQEPAYSQVWVAKLTPRDPQTGWVSLAADSPPQRAGDALNQTSQPDWSPDGILSFYDTNRKAFVVLDPRSGKGTNLPNQTGEPGSWQPDSKAYLAPELIANAGGSAQTTPDLKPFTSSHLIRYQIETGTMQDLSQAEVLEDTAPAYAPDGAQVAFARKFLDVRRWTPGRQLWLMNADGSNARQITNDPDYNHFDFAWEPGGERLAYVRFNQSAPTDPPAVYLYDFTKGYESEIVVGGYSPAWLP